MLGLGQSLKIEPTVINGIIQRAQQIQKGDQEIKLSPNGDPDYIKQYLTEMIQTSGLTK
jgi:hypothetical protein